MNAAEITEALRKCELFGTLTQEQIIPIVDLCGVETYEAGEPIFMQGEATGKLYLIVEGQVALQRLVSLGARRATVAVGLLGRGRVLGWSALLCMPGSRTATAVCQKITRVISMDGDRLRSVLQKEPQAGFVVMERLAHVLGDRLRTAYTALDTHL